MCLFIVSVSFVPEKINRTEVIETRKRGLNSNVEPITNIKPDNQWPTLNRIKPDNKANQS